MPSSPVVYRIDARDRLIFANREWDAFALANGAPELKFEAVAGRPLWDFITDPASAHLYRRLLERARAGHGAAFPFRCDSPDCRRYLEMDIRPLENGEVAFWVAQRATELRAPEPLLEREFPRSREALRICSWCKRVPLGENWLEVEDAARSLALFDSDFLPRLTHGICPDCGAKMEATLH